MSDIPNFAKLVPGFDFLQGLVKNAGSALPGIGQWVAPTLDPEELHKRIEELRTVQFWLEQNAKMLGTTIQAMEVQRMTLSTLRTMNVRMTDLRDAMKVPPAAPEPAPVPPPAAAAPAGAEAPAAPGIVDPMQWWGALTKQFTQIAAAAIKDGATDAARNLAGAMTPPGADGARRAPAAAPTPAAAATAAAAAPATARKAAAGAAPKAAAKTTGAAAAAKTRAR